MGWNGSGVWSAPSLPGSFNPAITGQQATAADWNTFLAALAGTDGLSKAICRDGQTTITANLPMSGFRHTGVGDASALTHYGVVGQIINNDYIYGADIGVADAYEVTLPVPIGAYLVGQEFRTIIAHTNLTTTPTFKITGLAAGTIVTATGAALGAGTLAAGSSAVFMVSAVSGGGTPTFQIVGGAGMQLVDLTSGVTGILPRANGGTGFGAVSPLTASLGADVPMNSTATYFTGPTVAQGTTGTWYASGTVVVDYQNGNSVVDAKLWDGTTVIASVQQQGSAEVPTRMNISLSGLITSPVGNICISVRNETVATGSILYNASGNGKDSTISAFRLV